MLVGFEKSAELLAYLLSKSINEQGGIFCLLRETRISIRILFGNTADCGILMEFFNNFDQMFGKPIKFLINFRGGDVIRIF